MSVSPGPWRVGGQARLSRDGETENAAGWVELPNGRDIWDADGNPVVMLDDWFDHDDLELIASAPTLAAEHAELVESLRMLTIYSYFTQPARDVTVCDWCDGEISHHSGHTDDCEVAKAERLLARIDARKEASRG